MVRFRAHPWAPDAITQPGQLESAIAHGSGAEQGRGFEILKYLRNWERIVLFDEDELGMAAVDVTAVAWNDGLRFSSGPPV